MWYQKTSIGKAGTLVRLALDGSSAPEDMVRGKTYVQPQGWSPDGTTLVYTRGGGEPADYDIWTFMAAHTRKPWLPDALFDPELYRQERRRGSEPAWPLTARCS